MSLSTAERKDDHQAIDSDEEDEQSTQPMEVQVSPQQLAEILSFKEDPATGKWTESNLMKRRFMGQDLNSASIFQRDDPVRLQVLDKLDGKAPWASPAEDRAVGVMCGMALGDAIGARVEFRAVRYGAKELVGVGFTPGGAFQLNPGQWTDDASMGLCLADSLIATKGVWSPHDCMHRFLAWWEAGYDNCFRFDEQRTNKHSVGLGGNISGSFSAYGRLKDAYTQAGDKETSGNGSVMRNAAVPCLFVGPDMLSGDEELIKAEELARKQSRVTHQGEEAAECCALLTHVCVRGIRGEPLREVLGNLQAFAQRAKRDSVKALALSEQENNDPDRDWRWRAADYKYSPKRAAMQPGYVGSYAMDATAMALHCVWKSVSFSEAVLTAANLRGDADSVASVCGQIAGSFYGASTIPKDWLAAMRQWDGDGEIPMRAYRLFNKLWL